VVPIPKKLFFIRHWSRSDMFSLSKEGL